MPGIFFGLYQFIQQRKWLIPIGFVTIFLSCGMALWHTELKEDITAILPSNNEVKKFNAGFLESELANRIVFHLYSEDSLYADHLTGFCQDVVDSLENSDANAFIKSITYRVDPDIFQQLSENVIEHLPLFLSESDYDEIENRINEAAIKERTFGAYKALISPASFAFKDIIRKDPLGFSSLVFEALTNIQLDENFELYDNYLLTRDKKHLLFFISPKNSSQESTNNARLIEQLNTIGNHFQLAYPQCQIEYFGGPVISVANANRIKKDVTLTVSIALFSLLILIGYFYGNWKIFFYILIPVLSGGAMALALIGLIKPSISIIAIGVGSVLIGIGIDFSIHLFTHFKKIGNVKAVLSDVSMPLLVSAGTTSVAFLCLYFVRSTALHDLGLFAAVSVFCSALLAIIILPHFFKNTNTTKTNSTFLDKIAAFPFERKKWLVYGVLILFAFCAYFAPKVSFERDLNKINYMPQSLQTAEAHINEISDATKRGINLIAFSDNLNTALDVSEDIVPVLTQLKQEGKIGSFTSPNQLMSSEASQQRKIDRWNQFWSRGKKDRVERHIIQHTAALNFKPDAFSPFFDLLNKKFSSMDPVDLDATTGHLLKDYFTINEKSSTAITMIRLDQDQKKYIHEAFAKNPNLTIIDKEYIVHQFVDILKTDFNKLVWISLLVVFLIMHLVYGRIELALVAFLPILFSWTITLGLMNLLDIKFNIVNIIITSFIFGLGIDYSIFVMRGLLQNYASAKNNLNSYKTSIILSSSTTLIGIGVLIFAQHPALKSIAAISLIGIFSVVVVTFVLQPLIFRWLTEKKGIKRPYPLTLFNMGKTLWVYIVLVIGCIILTMIGILLNVLIFIPKEKRKLFLHYCIYYASRIYIKSSFLSRISYNNLGNEDFKKPCLVLANHKSLIDTPLLFQLSPKIIIITNDWVSKSPLYRIICKMADFYSISQGADELLEKLADRVSQGYSIAIFPEGTRSRTEKLLRLKKGAFYLSEKLELDIVPMFIHGTHPFLSKGNFWGRANNITVQYDHRIPFESKKYGDDYSSYTKNFGRWFKGKYHNMRLELEDVDYHREEIISNYLYKGPLTEWYSKVKTGMEDNYRIFDNLIPSDSLVSDLGCGLGHMTYFLGKSKPDRQFIAIDYDEHKIEIARNCAMKKDNMEFIHGDITRVDLKNSDVFVISDVIHYLKPEQQTQLLNRCHAHLNPGGKIILRDGDRDMDDRHRGTKLTEIFSTNFGFNKTQNKLNYISGNELKRWADNHSLKLSRLDETRYTSNVIFVMNHLE